MCENCEWVNPWPMAGFQGFRYALKSDARRKDVTIIGDWKEPMPPTPPTR